jgi:hypothetical protein
MNKNTLLVCLSVLVALYLLAISGYYIEVDNWVYLNLLGDADHAASLYYLVKVVEKFQERKILRYSIYIVIAYIVVGAIVSFAKIQNATFVSLILFPGAIAKIIMAVSLIKVKSDLLQKEVSWIGISVIVTLVFGILNPFVFALLNNTEYLPYLDFVYMLPYIFIVTLALKLENKSRSHL